MSSISKVLALAAVLVGMAIPAAGSAAPAADVTSVRFQQEPMRWHMQSGRPHYSLVGDAATAYLLRTANGLFYAINTNQLQPGHAVTVWVVVVNNPSACSASPCSPPDLLLNPATRSQITYGTGRVAWSDGRAIFAGVVRRGALSAGWLPNQGLDDPLGAEVHFVLNDHGPVLAGFMPEMIRTYRAGCTDASLPAIFPASAKADGTPGPNTCRLWQLAVFQ